MNEVVIKIPKDTYKEIIKNGFIFDEDGEVISHAIINGTPLSKGHGRLIDADAIPRHLVRDIDEIDKQPTIIEGSDNE